jgi:4-amino-4-deoxy-L-arabinose transferase-like glycosyltransferase
LHYHNAFGNHVGTRARSRSSTGTWHFVLRELVLWACVYPLYLAIRGWSIADPQLALSDASRVIRWERTFDLFHEVALQQRLEPLESFFSAYYMLGFGPVLAVLLLWLVRARRGLYCELRTMLFVSLGIALVVYLTFPTAPPRLVPGLGVADTVGLSGHDTGSFAGVRFNPYAAMPSLHVGWSLLAAIVLFRATSRRWVRALAVAHPVLMMLAVTQTGNHYLADSLAGILVALIALTAVGIWTRRTGHTPARSRAGMHAHQHAA